MGLLRSSVKPYSADLFMRRRSGKFVLLRTQDQYLIYQLLFGTLLGSYFALWESIWKVFVSQFDSERSHEFRCKGASESHIDNFLNCRWDEKWSSFLDSIRQFKRRQTTIWRRKFGSPTSGSILCRGIQKMGCMALVYRCTFGIPNRSPGERV